MLTEKIKELYRAEIEYLEVHHSGIILSNYLEELVWIDEELNKWNPERNPFNIEFYLSLEKLRSLVIKRINSIIFSETNTEIAYLTSCIEELNQLPPDRFERVASKPPVKARFA
ncbi:hypothetical protein ABER99_20385 [Paenibacillus glucanolyticus]|jgi:hypothetical protein|uniref:Uncharacterized protein n=1 Tax=Paenibacillus glucanolyticus TaxID=59843 RepID=A0A163GIC7_9BACL|nr:hypothetical protein [Paenibacillus glucanolyticus]KZS44989.1 hypothetical protein AWU65_03135 [Paenibacillus glucanolyticus]OMF63635.1 hypothetical protein BK142_32585 [Paenibacillus glucanolyticus]